MKQPLLSIVIVNYNTKSFLKECLDNLSDNYTKQLAIKEYEIIVVDNNSADGSPQLIAREFPHVTLIAQTENTGFAAANNVGIAQAKGAYVLLLNPDTVVGDDVLPHMIGVMEHDHRIGVATCRINLLDDSLDDACHRGFPTPWRALCHFSGLARLMPHSMFFNGYHLGYRQMNKTHEIEACCGAFMLIRADVGRALAWLDEDYFWYGEDLDLCYRVKKRGFKVMFVPDVYILHYKGVSSGIKKHSQHIAVADRSTKLRATKARFDVMRIFYDKHYKNKYPTVVRWLVLMGIEVKYRITKFSLASS